MSALLILPQLRGMTAREHPEFEYWVLVILSRRHLGLKYASKKGIDKRRFLFLITALKTETAINQAWGRRRLHYLLFQKTGYIIETDNPFLSRRQRHL